MVCVSEVSVVVFQASNFKIQIQFARSQVLKQYRILLLAAPVLLYYRTCTLRILHHLHHYFVDIQEWSAESTYRAHIYL